MVSANPTAQEVLAYPVWQGAMASAAMPAGRNRRRRRFRSQWNSWGQGWGTLMRHFFVFGPVTALALGVGMTASPAGLIAATGGTDSGASSLLRTRLGAVALAAIAVGANDRGLAAAGAKVVSSCRFHGQRPMGERQQGPLCEICPEGNPCGTWQATLPVRTAGRGIGTGLVVGAGVAPASPPAIRTMTAFALLPLRLGPIRCPQTLPHYVCQTAVCCANHPPEALRAAR